MSKIYNQIKDDLLGLNIRDQYELLLQTNEWYNFRHKIIDQKGGAKCEHCERVEGPIEEPIMSEEEYGILLAEISEHNRKFEKQLRDKPKKTAEMILNEMRDNPEKPRDQILFGDGLRRKNTPSRFKDVGNIIIQIHHTLYFWNKLPWEYQSKHLKVLCDACHKQEHQTNTIYVYKDETMSEKKVIPICSRCDGSGFIPEYFHIQKGICFECWGAGCLLNAKNIWEPV